MATPLLHGLVCHAEAKVEVLTEPAVIALLEDTFPTARFHATRKLDRPLELLRQAKEIRAMGVGDALVINRSFRSALVARLAGIPKRYGHSTDGRGFLLTRSMPYNELQFEADSYLEVAKLAGFDLPHTHPTLSVSKELVEETRPMLAGATVGIQPGARHPWKEIPLHILAELVRALQSDGHTIALFGGPEEKQFGKDLVERLETKPVDLIGAFPLKATLAAVSQMRCLVGADTGLVHMAAAVGCPTVTAFGPTESRKWAHDYPPHKFIVAPGEHMSGIPAADLIEATRSVLTP